MKSYKVISFGGFCGVWEGVLQCYEMGVECYRGVVTMVVWGVLNEINNLAVF